LSLDSGEGGLEDRVRLAGGIGGGRIGNIVDGRMWKVERWVEVRDGGEVGWLKGVMDLVIMSNFAFEYAFRCNARYTTYLS
jgi:hypothetical protein